MVHSGKRQKDSLVKFGKLDQIRGHAVVQKTRSQSRRMAIHSLEDLLQWPAFAFVESLIFNQSFRNSARSFSRLGCRPFR